MKSSIITKRLRISRLGNPRYAVPPDEPPPQIPELEPEPVETISFNIPVTGETWIPNTRSPIRGACLNTSRLEGGYTLTYEREAPLSLDGKATFSLYTYVSSSHIQQKFQMPLSFSLEKKVGVSPFRARTFRSSPQGTNIGSPVIHDLNIGVISTHSFILNCNNYVYPGIKRVTFSYDLVDSNGVIVSSTPDTISYIFKSANIYLPPQMKWKFYDAPSVLLDEGRTENITPNGRIQLTNQSPDPNETRTLIVPFYFLYDRAYHEIFPGFLFGGGCIVSTDDGDVEIYSQLNGNINPPLSFSRNNFITDPLRKSGNHDIIVIRRNPSGQAEISGLYFWEYIP